MADNNTASQQAKQEDAAWEEKKRTRERVSHIMGQYLLKGYRMLGSNCPECENILMQTREGKNYCIYCMEIGKVSQCTTVTTQSSDSHGSSSSRTSTCVTSSTRPRVTTHKLTSTTKPTPSQGTSGSSPATTNSSSSPPDTGGRGENNKGARVPVVCTGKTSDTFKLTTTPAADHDSMKMCTDSKRTGIRTHSSIIQSMVAPMTPPPDKIIPTTMEPHSPTNTQQQQQQFEDVRLPKPRSDGSNPVFTYSDVSRECQAVLLLKLKWCTEELERTDSVEYSILVCRLITSTSEALRTLQETMSGAASSPSAHHSTADHMTHQ